MDWKVSSSLCGKESRVAVFEKGACYNLDGITVVDLYGSWLDMGRQYGSLCKEYLCDVLRYIYGKTAESKSKLDSAIDISERLYSHYPAYLQDFFAGMAETSGMNMRELRLCNALEYVEGCFFCSAMAAWNEYSADGRLIYGRNYDAVSYSELSSDVIITVYHPNGAHSVATIGYAGEIYCVNGLNDQGIFIELNNGMPSAGWDIHWDITPGTTILFDTLLHADSLDDVDKTLCSTQSFASFIIGVADKSEARAYEWCHDGIRRGDETPDGLLAITNHYVNSQWSYGKPTDSDSWNSLKRLCNIHTQAKVQKGNIDALRMRTIMTTPIEADGPLHSFTRYQMVIVPETLTLHIRITGSGEWTEIDMRRFLDVKNA